MFPLKKDTTDLSFKEKKANYLRIKRRIKKIRVFLSRFRVITRLLMMLLIGFGVWNFAHSKGWYIPPDLFKYYPVSEVEIMGNDIVSDDQIIRTLRGHKFWDKPIYLLDTTPLEQDLMKLSPIKKVYIRRYGFPARLRVSIFEKLPALSISPNMEKKPIAVMTMDGSIIGRDFLPIKNQKVYLVLTYEHIEKWSAKHVKYLLTLAKYTEAYSKQEVKYIDIRNKNDVYIQLESLTLRLGALDKDIFSRLKRIVSILPEIKGFNKPIKYVDLRWKTPFLKLKK